MFEPTAMLAILLSPSGNPVETHLRFFLLCKPTTVAHLAVPGTVSFAGFPDFLSFFSAGPDGIKQPSVLPFTQICFKYRELPYR